MDTVISGKAQRCYGRWYRPPSKESVLVLARGVNVSEQRSHQCEKQCAGQAGHAAVECAGLPTYSWTLHHVTSCVLLQQNRQAVAYMGRETSRHLLRDASMVSQRDAGVKIPLGLF